MINRNIPVEIRPMANGWMIVAAYDDSRHARFSCDAMVFNDFQDLIYWLDKHLDKPGTFPGQAEGHG